MATYFHETSEIQATSESNLQTLYLMNPNYLPPCSQQTQIPHTQTTPSSILFTASHALMEGSLPHAPPHQQLDGIPLPGPHFDRNNNTNSGFWGPTLSPVEEGPMGWKPIRHPQGLSLSLSPHNRVQNGGRAGVGPPSGSSGVEVVGRSKYLKVVQELLDEVVSVVDFKGCPGGAHNKKGKEVVDDGGGGGGGGCGVENKRLVDDQLLTTTQRQELEMKKAKLVNMLDEVEKRYNQYHTQMQQVISAFEQISGIGSAKSYTYLALKAVSRQFRCLKDAILSQIRSIGKTLGEYHDMGDTNNRSNNDGRVWKVEGGGGGGSRLRLVDHHQIRQQQVLQQLGVMHHHNAWRPQRGLPERAVSVLRAWLFEHFLHPYPKDSDKHMLAKQTGLSRSQVSNWFINARVRLWKPMVEEMYMEEMKTHDQKDYNSNNNGNVPSNDHNKDQSPSKATHTWQQQQQQEEDNAISCMMHHQPHNLDQHSTNDMISNMSTMSTTSTQGFTLVGSSSDMESLVGQSPKKQRSGSDIQNSPSSILSMDMETKTHIHHHNQINKYSQDPRNGSGLNPYVIPDIGRFNPDQIGTHGYQYPGNNVSLSLGLPPCENLPTLSNHEQQDFIEEGEFCGISMGQPSHPSNVYDSIDIQSRKRFAAQLLHDFVA